MDPDLMIKGDYVIVRMALVDALEGNFPAAIILQRIYWRCERDGSWDAPVAEVAQETRQTLRTTQRALAMLQAKGWVVRSDKSAWDKTSVWTVALSAVRGAVDTAPEAVSDTAPEAVSSYENTETGVTPPTPSLAFEEMGFDQFWSHYPRKVGKPQARKAYLKALTRAPVGQINQGAIDYQHDPNLPEERFRPHPATWLNRDGWLDGPCPARFTPGKATPNQAAADALALAARLRVAEQSGIGMIER